MELRLEPDQKTRTVASFPVWPSGTTIRATRGMAPMLLPARRGVKKKQGLVRLSRGSKATFGIDGGTGAWGPLVLVLVLVLEEAVSYPPSAIGQSLRLVPATWHGRPARVRNPDGHGQPPVRRSTGKPVPHWKPQRGVILSACGQRPRSSSAKREKPCKGDIRGGVAAEIHSAPSGLGRLFGLVPEALPLAMVFRRIAAGGGWRRKMCRPYGAPRAASRCTGADAPAYNVSPLRGWGRSETFIARSFFPRPELDKVTDSMISSLPGVAGYN